MKDTSGLYAVPGGEKIPFHGAIPRKGDLVSVANQDDERTDQYMVSDVEWLADHNRAAGYVPTHMPVVLLKPDTPDRDACEPDEIRVFKDGNAWCAVRREGFTNIQECTAGFGDTPHEAVKKLLTEEP